MLVDTNTVAPKAGNHNPEPIKIPKTTSGGNRATETITPTTALFSPVVKEIAPATPEAKARATSDKSTLVLKATSLILDKSTDTNIPKSIERAKAIKICVKPIIRLFLPKDISPKVVANPKAIFGLSKGATTIAPMTMTSLPRSKPIAAIIVERITNRISVQLRLISA